MKISGGWWALLSRIWNVPVRASALRPVKVTDICRRFRSTSQTALFIKIPYARFMTQLTDSMEETHFSEDNKSSVSQEIPRIL